MTYKIMVSSSTDTAMEYWTFVRVDETSKTVFSSKNLDDVEVKLKSLMETVPITKLKVITEVAFTSDLIFI